MAGESSTLLNTITGVILVGGKSRRMGTDKAFLLVDGQPLFERILDAFRDVFTSIILTGDRADAFSRYGLPVHHDIYPGSALGGLYTGVYRADTPAVFVSSCDVPFPSSRLIRYLCDLLGDYDAVVPVRPDGYEPLFAVYAKSCLPAMESLLQTGNMRVYDFYPQVRVRFVHPDEITGIDPDGVSMINVNTPEEFYELTKGAGRGKGRKTVFGDTLECT